MTVAIPQPLEEWAPPDADWTSGLLLRYEEGYLFALEPHTHWTWDERGIPRIRVVGIGGHRAPGETWSEAVQREAWEEAGVEVALTSSPETDLLGPGDAYCCIALAWPGHPCPRLVWQAAYQFQDRATGQAVSRTYVGLVFQGRIVRGSPRPGAEVPGLLCLGERHLLRLSQAALPVHQVVAEGARVLPGTSGLPESALLTLGGSAQWIARWLQVSAPRGQR
ncbi:MAG: NUDIX domain-containing protein [Anaerolineae bacterium]